MSSSSLRSSCRFISFDEIRHEDGSVPFDFDKGKILGKGGEATVYLACLYTGQKKTLIAVKRLTYNATHEFESEIQTMSKIHHSNTVSLLGYCGQSGQKILIYEYMEKGNLTNYIIPKAGSIILSWKQRLNICLGAARGLQYLHTKTVEFPKGIIHRDIKPDNILINENWVGKIADFGMVKLSHADQVKSTMITNIKGTMGFYAPEYLSLGTVSRKIDVYAFGVVLFYVLCLKSPWNRGAESYYRREDEDLGLYAQQCIDTRIKEEISHDSLKVYTDTIQGSLQVDPKLRPDMDTVVLKLEKALECQNLQDEALKCQNLQDEAKRATSLKSPWNRGAESYYRREDEDLGLYAQQCIDTRIKEEISHDSLKVYTDAIQGSLQVDPELPPYMDTVELKLLKALECQNLQDEALECHNLQDEAKQGTSFRFDDIMTEKSRLWSVKYGRRPGRST